MRKYILIISFLGLLSCQTYKCLENKLTQVVLKQINSNDEFKTIYDKYCKKDEIDIKKRFIVGKEYYVYDIIFPVKEEQKIDGWWTNKYAIKVIVDKNYKVLSMQAGISGLILITE